MSRITRANSLTKEQEAFILKHLKVTPIKSSTNPRIPDPIPLICWFVKNGNVHLPFLFFEKMNKIVGPLMEVANDEVNNIPKSLVYQFTTEPRDYQVQLLADSEQQLREHKTTRLWTHPGSGKTAMAMYLASKFTTNKPTLILLPSKTALIKSWEGTVSSMTDTTAYIVGTTKKLDIEQLYSSSVIICLDSRLNKLPDVFVKNIGVLIVDECHTFAKTQGRIDTLLSICPTYVILATATFEMDCGMHRFLVLVAGHHHVRKEYTNKIRIVKVNTRVNPVLSEPDIGILRYKLIRDDRYTGWVINAVKKYIAKEKILILTWLTEHIDNLMPALKSAGIPATSYFGNQVQYTENSVCVSTLSKIGFGFDEAHCAVNFSGIPFSAILLPLSVKDSSFYEQVIGRGMRTVNPLFITFIDSHFLTKSHWKKNLEWIKSHNVDLTEVDANDL